MKPADFIALCYADPRAAVLAFCRGFFPTHARVSTYEKALVASRMREVLGEMEAALPASVVAVVPALIDAGHELHCQLCVHTSPRAQRHRREMDDEFSAAAWAALLDGFVRERWPQAQANQKDTDQEPSRC